MADIFETTFLTQPDFDVGENIIEQHREWIKTNCLTSEVFEQINTLFDTALSEMLDNFNIVSQGRTYTYLDGTSENLWNLMFVCDGKHPVNLELYIREGKFSRGERRDPIYDWDQVDSRAALLLWIETHQHGDDDYLSEFIRKDVEQRKVWKKNSRLKEISLEFSEGDGTITDNTTGAVEKVKIYALFLRASMKNDSNEVLRTTFAVNTNGRLVVMTFKHFDDVPEIDTSAGLPMRHYTLH